jgi:hypothetical protein
LSTFVTSFITSMALTPVAIYVKFRTWKLTSVATTVDHAAATMVALKPLPLIPVSARPSGFWIPGGARLCRRPPMTQKR